MKEKKKDLRNHQCKVGYRDQVNYQPNNRPIAPSTSNTLGRKMMCLSIHFYYLIYKYYFPL